MVLVILFEIISVTAFIPLLDFLQNGGNLNFKDSSFGSSIITKFINF